MRIGFIGLGLMGSPMAARVLDAGHEVAVHSRRRASAAQLEERGARWSRTPNQLAQRSSIVVTMLPTGEDVRTVLFGTEGIFSTPGARPIIVDMSTIGPADAVSIGREVGVNGGSFIDAPVSGGPGGAAAGTLSIMVGASDSSFTTVADLLAILGRATHLGPLGSGQRAKLVNQILIGGIASGVAEAFAVSRAAGLDPDRMLDAIRGGMGDSNFLGFAWPRLGAGDLEPGFKISHFIKDLRLAIETATAAGIDADFTNAVLTAYLGLGDDFEGKGTQALVRAIREHAD